jgi:uncharacterized membrane protein (UPF0182 family)
MKRWIVGGGIIVALIALFILLTQAIGIYTDWLWFGNLGFRSVFATILGTKIWLFFAGALVFAVLLVPNIFLAHRLSRRNTSLQLPQEMINTIKWGSIGVVILVALIMSIVFGVVAMDRWETFIIFMNRVSFGVADAHYGKDISFYVAVLPVLHLIQGWLMGAIIAIAVAMGAYYFLRSAAQGSPFEFTERIRIHFAVLGALLMISIAAAHHLDTYEPLFSGGGAAFGASYTDVTARILALHIITGVALLAAIGFIASIFYGGLRFMIASFGLWVLFAIVVGALIPLLVQRFSVDPDEFNKEKPYIQRNLDATQAAYGLEDVQVQEFPYRPTLTAADVAENSQTIKNVRLWDPVPLTANYNRVQFFELYYDFVEMDVDRYIIDGEYRQVMLSGRELAPEGLPEEAQRWVNRKLQYTHGYGVAMSPVTSYTREGTPEFLLRDIPPAGSVELTKPEIYYGENTSDFVIVNTQTEEFDYPGLDGEPVRTRYQGPGGVPVGSFIRQLSYAWEFLDVNILISNQLTNDSRIMYRRNIPERVGEVAPFLMLDSDPYLVVADEKIWWIQDAYTTTDRYPYSLPTDEGFNYIRNSVKVVVDAADGQMSFYVVDPTDPVVQIYMKAFPDLFEPVASPDPFTALPESLRSHVRYPIDLFSIQAERYLQYHMEDPLVFYQKEDQWAFGNELFRDEPQQVKPYYVITKLPGEDKEEFMLIMPFTPFEKKTMVAWMAARNDVPYYGQLQTFTFAGNVSGPELVEARITNDDDIRERLTLLCPPESSSIICIRGNLLVVPLAPQEGQETSPVIYVEPLFIRPATEDFPPLKQVFVADGTSVVMADTLQQGINELVNLGSRESGSDFVPLDAVPVPAQPGTGPTIEFGELTPETQQRLEDLLDDIRTLRENLGDLEKELEEVAAPTEGSTQ